MGIACLPFSILNLWRKISISQKNIRFEGFNVSLCLSHIPFFICKVSNNDQSFPHNIHNVSLFILFLSSLFLKNSFLILLELLYKNPSLFVSIAQFINLHSDVISSFSLLLASLCLLFLQSSSRF